MASNKTYTVNDLIDSVLSRGTVPEGQRTYTDEDILRFANEEISENLAALILSCREEFYVVHEDIEIVNGTKEYTMPYRALGSKVRIIKPLDTNGNETGPLPFIMMDNAIGFNSDATYANYTAQPFGFYVRNDKIVLTGYSDNFPYQRIRVYYYLRPNNLVEMSRVAKITNINFDTNVVSVQTVPTGMSSNTELDLIQATPNFKIYSFDLSATVNSLSKQITFVDAVPTELSVGDYVCFAGETPSPQIPKDVLPILEQSTVCKILEAQGDTEGLKNGYVRLDKLEKRLLTMLDSRVESPGKRAVQQNGLLGGRYRNRW